MQKSVTPLLPHLSLCWIKSSILGFIGMTYVIATENICHSIRWQTYGIIKIGAKTITAIPFEKIYM